MDQLDKYSDYVTPISPKDSLTEGQTQISSATPDLNMPNLETKDSIDSVQSEIQKQDIDRSSFYASQTNPSEHTRAYKLAQQMNMQSSFVKENLKYIQQQKEKKDLADKLNSNVTTAPKTVEFLSNPDNLSMTKEEIDNMFKLEQQASNSSFIKNSYNAILAGTAHAGATLAETPAYIGNVTLLPYNIMRKTLGYEPVEFKIDNELSNYYKRGAEFYSNQIPQKNVQITDKLAEGKFSEAGAAMYYQALENIPQLAMIATSAATGAPVAGLAYAGLSTAADKASEMQNQGIEPIAATTIAAQHGALEVLFEEMGSLSIFKNTMNSIATNYGKQAAKDVAFNFGKMALINSGQEFSAEALTQFSQDFTDYVSGVNPDAMKGAVGRALSAGIVGGFTGGVLETPAAISLGHSKIVQIRQAEANIKTFQAIAENSKSSQLLKNLPEKYKEFVDHVTKDGPVENTIISLEGFNMLFQTENTTPAQVASELGILEQYNTAIDTGNDIQIKTSDYATKIAPSEYQNELYQHLKFNENEKTPFEAKREYEETKIDLNAEYEKAKEKSGRTKEEVKKIEQSAKAVGEDVTKQLIETNQYPEDAAKQMGSVSEKIFRIFGLRENIDPMDIYKNYNLKITKGKYEGLVKKESTSIIKQPIEDLSELILPSIGTDFLYTNKNNSHALINQKTNDSVHFELQDKSINVNKLSVTNPDMITSFINGLTQVAKNKESNIVINKTAIDELKTQNISEEIIKDKLINSGYEVNFDNDGNANLTEVVKLSRKEKIGARKKGSAKQDNRGGIFWNEKNQFNIDLFEKADTTTFLHESAHFYLEVFGDLAEREMASQSLKDDYAKILNYLNVENRSQILGDQHEVFARSFESYLMEGKAPSRNLRSAFNRFKEWFGKIYKDATQLNVPMNDEIRGVFDRMLASDAQIKKAYQNMDLQEIPQEVMQQFLTDDEYKKYIDAKELAKITSQDELRSKLIASHVRKHDKAYKNKYEEIYKEELNKAGEFVEFKILDKITTGLKLDKNIIKNNFSEYMSYLPSNALTTKNGYHPNYLAEMYGIKNGEAVLRMIAPYRRGIKDFAEMQTATRMKAEFPDLLESPELSEEAIKAFHNDNLKAVKRLEMEYLAKILPRLDRKLATKLIRRMPTDRQVIAQAKELIANTKVMDIKPHTYRNAEKKHSYDAAKYFNNKEYEKAFESKRLEYLNFELYRQAMEAKEFYNGAFDFFRNFKDTDENLAKRRDLDLVKVGQAILSEYGITTSKESPYTYLEKVKQYQDMSVYNALLDRINVALINKGNFKEIKFEYFMDMYESVESVWDLSKSINEIEVNGKKMLIDEAVNTLGSRLQEITPVDTSKYKQTMTKQGKFKERLLGLKASLSRVEHWTKSIDGKDNGSFWKFIYSPVSDAVTKYRIEKNKVLKEYEALINDYKKNITFDTITSDELNFIFKDKSELMMAVLHSGNKSNLTKLLAGRGWGQILEDGNLDTSRWDSFIERMQNEGILKKEDFDFAQNVWNLLEGLKPVAQKAHKNIYGFYFNEITSEAFTTKYGEYKGGYIPAKLDVFASEDAKIRQEMEDFDKNNFSFQFPTTGRGFTKNRVENYNKPLSLDINMLSNHIDSVMKFSYIEPAIKSAAKIVFNSNFRSTLNAFDSKIASEMLVPWLQRTASQKNVLPSNTEHNKLVDAGAKYIRKGTAIQVMFGNVGNALAQATGLTVAMSVVEPKYFRNAMFNYTFKNKTLLENIYNDSQWMNANQKKNIFEVYNSIENSLKDKNIFESAVDFAKNQTYFLQSAVQNMVNTITWQAAYEQSIDKNMSHEEAIKQADSTVRMTQGTQNPEDISRFETGTNTELLFKQFTSYFNMIANLNGYQFAKISREMGLRKGAGKLFWIYSMSIMLPSVLNDIIAKSLAGKFDEDDDGSYMDDILKSFFGSQFKTVAATLPFVGQAMVATYNRMFTKTLVDDRFSLSPAIQILESTVNSPINVYKDIMEKGEASKKSVKDVMQLMGIMTHMPLGPIGKPVGYLMDVNAGNKSPENSLDFARGLITGK